MAVDPQIIRKLTEDLDNLNDVIDDVSKQIQNNLNKQLAVTSESINDMVEGLEKGEDVTKKAASALKKAQIENRKLGLDQNRIQSQLLEIEKKLAKGYSAKLKAQKDSLEVQMQDNLLQQQLNDSLSDYLRKLNEAAETESKISKQKGTQGILDDIKKRLRLEEIKDMFTLASIFKIILDSALGFNKASVEIGKNLGYGADQADRVTNNIVNAARGSENLNFTLANAAAAMSELNASIGLVAEYSADTLETQIMLTKQFGLQADEAAGIYKFSVLTGKSASETNKAMVSAFVAARNQFKVGANFKQVMAEAAKVSGQLAANLGYNPDRITKAVVAMKAFGTTLEQTKAQGEALLNFESSLEAELKAELLTGQAINLERARAAALAGDQVKLAEELANQGMTLEKFQKMNVLAQKSYSEALGLSADQLSEQLQKQKLAIESGKSLAQLTEEEALEAQKRQNIQDQFNQAMLKLQDIIGGLVAGPLGMMLSVLSDALSLIGKIVAGIQSVLGSGLTKVLLGTITGLAVGGPVGALVGGIAGIASAAIADDMVGYGARTLVTPDGPIALNNNDTVIAGTNLFKGDDVMSFGKGALRLGGGNDELIAKLDQIASRPAVAYIQGERPFADTLGRQSQLFTSGMQNQSKLA
jgi:hypothetical protein